MTGTTASIPVFYSPKQVAVTSSESPSAGKPAAVVASWQELGLPIRIAEPQSVTVDDFVLAHDRSFVEDVLACRRNNGFDNRSVQVAAALPWTTEPTLKRESGPASPTDQVGLSHALAAIAETGTLTLASGADNPVTLNFVPENHIIVVEDTDLVGPYEDVWTRVRTRFGKTHMPRTLNFISGPSRTADIGGKLVTGAHGPRRLCVVLVRT